MKILLVGFFKTGTKTMNEALEILGYKVSENARDNEELKNYWWKFLDGKGTTSDLKVMFEGFDAAGDAPSFIFWKDFLKAFPDIKLILTTRNVDAWIKSLSNQVKEINESDLRFPLSLFSRRAREYFRFGITNLCKAMDQPMIKNRSILCSIPLPSERILKEGYERHVDNVKKNAPQNQLLVYNVKEGWEPLCRFLGKDLPNVPFPHRNKRGEIISWRLKNNEFMLKMYREMYINISIIVLVVSVAIYCYTFVL